MNKIIPISLIIIILLFGGYFIFSNSYKNSGDITNQQVSLSEGTESSPLTQKVDKKASFAIFTNGTFRIFTAAMYHNLSQNVYIEASNPNIVQIKKAGTTWNDFFVTLPFKLTSECLTTGTKETYCNGNGGTLQFYLNGEKNNNALNLEIKEGDKLLVTFGIESEEVIEQQIQKIPQNIN